MSNLRSRQFERQTRRCSGFSLIELLIVVAIILIIAGIAIPNLLRSKMAANESSAVESIHAVLTASSVYYTEYDNGYPPTAGTMGPTTTPTCNLSGLIDPLLANAPNQKSGYTVTYTGQGGNVTPPTGCGTAGFLGFVVSAVPMTVGVTGARSFCSSEDGVIHDDPTGSPITTSTACDALPVLTSGN
jgi:type IV pilus assembly protein PilA